MTVLFADLSGFTTLAERLDPEDVRAFQGRLFETLGGIITRFDGFVEKFVGDAVLAVFGAPVAHEDDPERACDAALEMLERSSTLNREWELRLGQPVLLHIGIHTGPVVAGHLGDAAGAAYAVTGDTVNTTARLLAAAPPGTILISGTTHALVRHRFASEPSGELTLRGKTEPVAAHRLTGAQTARGSARGLVAIGLTSPFVGRNDELDQLAAAFARMRRGQAQVVSLVGEAGIGKSRLIAELITRFERDGQLADVAVRHVACSSLGEPTYGVFGALFREGYRIDSTDSLDVAREKLIATLSSLGAREAEANAIAPVLGYLLGLGGDSAPDIEPEQLRRQILLAARVLIERRLDNAPVLVTVDDVQWADTASVELLRDVADQLADRPLMLLLTLRPEARPPLCARAAHSVIRVAPLSGDETRALIAGLFAGSPDVVSHVADFVAARAGGNPLFAEEIVRNLVGRGVLQRDAAGWTCTAACEGVEVPPSLHGLLLSRVDRLSADARRVLQEAAVLGAEFDAPLLRAMSSAPETLPAALDRLVEADLVQAVDRRRTDGRYRFPHGLVREVVYQNLLLSRRTEMHERVGRALEAVVGARPERLSDLEALALHFSLSSDKLRGARYMVAAGDRARAVYANEDAIRHFERALETLAACPEDCEADARGARERLADLLALTGRRADALTHYESVLKKAEVAGDRAAAARLQRKIGGLHW
ncbi:MAG TPA: adenylate/guanylate cyclase domain-containing protein, partial [Candidatus Limnocylindria bacterium]|nr:adenylate/guanylate cyclase domain-containing protein [Candidatus Limnocylindria bacterium]